MDASGPDVTFLFQFGLIRDAVTVPQTSLNLKTLKNLACDFIDSKVVSLQQTRGFCNASSVSDLRPWNLKPGRPPAFVPARVQLGERAADHQRCVGSHRRDAHRDHHLG